MRWVWRVLIGLVVLVVVLAVVIRLTTFHPPEVASEDVVCDDDAPRLQAGQQVTVLNWNVQYFAGKDYVFWYDLLDESGPDTRPSPEQIDETLTEVAQVIADVQPDIVLLQEVDDGASRTDGEDQLELLLDELEALDAAESFACHASAFYWRAAFVPHPQIMGSVGMKLSTLSRYAIDEATRHQLAQMPSDLLTRQFDIRRATLETRLPVDGGEDLVVLNTHLDAFAQGTDTMEQQVAETRQLLKDLSADGLPWVIGGDFNLLPPGNQYERLPEAQRAYYAPESELAVLTDAYDSVPSVEEATGSDAEQWFTHFPNDPAVDGPDRTIDYLFYAPNLELGDHDVLQDGMLDISDHLPVVAIYRLPS